MLNVSQRLIFGCALLACLTIGLVAMTHHALAAAGQTTLAYSFVAMALLLEFGTIYFVLKPIAFRILPPPGVLARTMRSVAALPRISAAD